LHHYLAHQAGRTNMWRAALSPIASTLVTQRVAEVERNRFLAVGAVQIDRGRDGSLASGPNAQTAIATMREARAAGHSLRHCAEMVRERHGLEVSHMTVKRVLKADRTAA
jgi:hypothetical protein